MTILSDQLKQQYKLLRKKLSRYWWHKEYMQGIDAIFFGLKFHMPLFIVKYLAWQLQFKPHHHRTLRNFSTLLYYILNSGVTFSGLKLKFTGRLNGVDRSVNFLISRGPTRLSTATRRVNYALAHGQSIYGTVGIKFWLYYSL